MSILIADQEETPWQAKFPTPRTKEPNVITREELLAKLEAGEKGGRDFLLVDVRRTDHEVSSEGTTTLMGCLITLILGVLPTVHS